jgi:hypothetical protein
MKKARTHKMLVNLMQGFAKLTVLCLMLTLSSVTRGGQEPLSIKPLQLDGEVVDLKVEQERQSQIVRLRVKLKFTNTGERPVILLLGTYGEKEKKHWWVLNTTASQTLTEALDGKPFYIGPTGPANSKSLPMWKELRRRLNSSQAPTSLTQTIQPHETFVKEIQTIIVIHDDERISPGARLWLNVLLELWPDNIEPSRSGDESKSYGESLKQKWQGSGDLQLESILSSPIPFDLPPPAFALVTSDRR